MCVTDAAVALGLADGAPRARLIIHCVIGENILFG